jgi:hypothetical protein
MEQEKGTKREEAHAHGTPLQIHRQYILIFNFFFNNRNDGLKANTAKILQNTVQFSSRRSY